MQILMIAHSFPPELTGVGTVAYQHATGLRARGHSIEVITGGAVRRQRGHKGIVVTELPCSGNWVTGLRGDLAELRRIVLERQARGVDLIVVHCAQIWSLDGLFEIEAKLRVPVVLVSHGLSCFRQPGYASYWPRIAAFLRPRGALVALSGRLEEVEFARAHHLPPPAIIPNGIDLTEWDAATEDIRGPWAIGDAPWMLGISNHSVVKNHAAFWQLATAVRRRFPPAVATILGCSYPAAKWGLGRVGVKGGCWYACQLRALWDSTVALRSGARRNEVRAAIKSADLLVVTSSREAAPLVLLEAMAARKSWISLRVGAVDDLAGGIVVDSVGEMTDVSVQLLMEPAKRHALGEAGRRFVERDYQWSAIVDRHDRLYRKIHAESYSQ